MPWNGRRQAIGRWLEYVVPQDERRDPRFRAHIDRLSMIGLRIVGGVCLFGVLYFTLAGALMPEEVGQQFGGEVPVMIALLGIASLALSFWKKVEPRAREIAALIGYGVGVVQFWDATRFIDHPRVGYFMLSGIVTGVMLVGIAALPLKPFHVLALGVALAVSYPLALRAATPRFEGSPEMELLFVGEVVLLCTALTVVVYRQRVLAYRARTAAERAFEDLQEAQAKLLVSESAHSQSRFAAALSHELNTPLGALTSAFDTMLHVHKGSVSDRKRVAEILADVERSGRASAARLSETIGRMKYLSNLDRADRQPIDLNELCRETAALLRKELEDKARLQFELDEPLPPLRCRPQQIGAILSNLLRNAAAAIETGGTILVQSRLHGGNVVVEVRDDGRGIPPSQLATLFEPSFQVEGTRVATSNWGLFVSRAIAVEHGGQLEIESEEGRGTTARVVLPLKGIRGVPSRAAGRWTRFDAGVPPE